MILRIFGFSIVVTIAALVVAYLYGGWQALVLTVILGILEISLSFDNAVINATVLRRMSEFWQKIFLTIGILIAVFGMRVLFPLLIVWIASGLGPVEAIRLALNPPADGASHFPDGSPSYETLITDAHPQIASFGGMFLLMLFLDFVLSQKQVTWLSWIERPLQRIGRLPRLDVVLGISAILLTALYAAPEDDRTTVLIGGSLGMITYLLVKGLGDLFQQDPPTELEEVEVDLSRSGPNDLAKATGKAGFFLFLYLEVLDASFSFDGVIGAFAITADPIIIALGLGFIGAMFVRSLTVFFVRKGTLSEYIFLEHGAHWAIGALAAILLYSIGSHVSEIVTGLVGIVLIGAAFLTSLVVRGRSVGSA